MFYFMLGKMWTGFALCAVMVGANILCLIMYRCNKLGLKNRIDNEKMIVYAEGIAEQLENKGLGQFLMQDCLINMQFPKKLMKNPQALEHKLKMIQQSVLEYLLLPQTVLLQVKVIDSSKFREGSYSEKTAEYSSQPHIKIITLYIQEYYKPNQIVAVLCHELSHYFMEYHKLNWGDASLNEQRTDVVANLIGFNRQMREGYGTQISQKQEGSLIKRTTYRIGYITQEDCADLRVFLRQYRKQTVKKQSRVERENRIRREYIQRLTAAKDLVDQVDVINIPHKRDASREQIERIQHVLCEIESRDLHRELARFLGLTDNYKTEEELIQASKDLDNFCTELLHWLHVLSDTD